MPKCPHCGADGYMGAWIFECPTKSCQNYKAPTGTKGLSSIGIKVNVTSSTWICIWSEGDMAAGYSLLTWQSATGALIDTYKLPHGCCWQELVNAVEKHTPDYFMSNRSNTHYYHAGDTTDWVQLKAALKLDGRIT
jgi:hypothetical protein